MAAPAVAKPATTPGITPEEDVPSGHVPVLVVGGGPVGGQVARHLADAGVDVVLVEEHRMVGEPVQCAGLFTPRIFDLVDFPVDRVHWNSIRGAHVYSPGGHMIELDGGKTMAIAIDRAEFDRECVRSAARAGARIALGTKAVAAERNAGGGVTVRLKRDDGAESTLTADLVVGADGVQSRIAKWFGLPRAREVIGCYGTQMDGLNLTPSHVEMFVGKEQAPGFFSWMIPTNGAGTSGKVEVGVDIKAPYPAKHYYERMKIDPVSAPFFTDKAVECSSICAGIPLGPIKRTTADNVMLVGDAAAHAKPTSGGGVYTGLKCARQLADVALGALESEDLRDKRLKEYHKVWYDDIGRELWYGWRLRKAFMHLRDDQIEELFRLLDDPELLAVVNTLGDIDYPSKLAKHLWKKAPFLFKFSGAAVRSLFDN